MVDAAGQEPLLLPRSVTLASLGGTKIAPRACTRKNSFAICLHPDISDALWPDALLAS